MNKTIFIEKLYNTLIEEDEIETGWILPEYKDNLNQFISYASEEVLGKDISDLVFDVAMGQCSKASIKGKEYPLENINDLLLFINEYENENTRS